MRFFVLLTLCAALTPISCLAEQSAAERPFSFERDIVGLLTRRGCNGSSCHGGVKGRGGFKLSLDGIDPHEDFKWIVQGGGYQVLSPESVPPIKPRVDLKEPRNSLLLLKPTMTVPHGGGERFKTDSADYETILRWVRSGAPYGEGLLASLEAIEPSSAEIVLQPGESRQLRVMARFSGGRREDVTKEVRFQSLNSDIASTSAPGVIEAGHIGETSLILVWVGQTASVRVGVVGPAGAGYPKIRSSNFIDQYVFAKLRRFHIQPSNLSSDEEFLRRVCLDLTGTLPPPSRVREFVSSNDPRKREKLIDTLLDSPEYSDFWTFRLSDLFRVRGDYGWIVSFSEWVRKSVISDKPYDQMARDVIAARGYDGPAHLNMVGTNKPYPVQQILNGTLRVFWGRRFDCAQCHNHPFEHWTQNQYWGLAGFYGQMTNTGSSYDDAIFDDAGGSELREVTHPRTKQLVRPAFLDGTVLTADRRDDPRMALAKWITSHPYFAEAAVNRFWSYFFGRGIVDPVDDFRVSNPPTNPELLEALASDFREHNFDIKHLIRTIVSSKTYQLSSEPNQSNRRDEINYSHALFRPLETEVLLDAISQVTGVPEVLGKMPVGTRAIQLLFPAETRSPVAAVSPFLEVFGVPPRDVVVERSGEPNLVAALHMLAGPTFNLKLSKEGGRLDRLLKRDASDGEIVQTFYLAALSRLPTQRELAGYEKMFATRPRREAMEDFLWALLTSRTFSENH